MIIGKIYQNLSNTAIPEKPVVPGGLIWVVMLACVSTFFFANGFYLFFCMLTMIALFAMLWHNNRPGILLFAFFMQWTQVISFIIWLNWNDVSFERVSRHSGTAVIMSCLGLLVMGAVLAKRVNALPIPSLQELAYSASLINEKKILILYLTSTLFLSSIGFALGNTSGFAQILITLSSIKWVFFMVYGYVAWINKKNRLILLVIILFEFSTSLYSYFSSFRNVILITIILALTFLRKISFWQFVSTFLIGTLLGILLVTWTAIKSEYRDYLNNGTRHQIVTVSREQAFNKMSAQLSQLNWRRYQTAVSMSLYRLQYIYHMARTMDRVPDVIPHENGRLWLNNISYVVMPRLLFPGKPLFDATEKTNKYTGIRYSGLKQGSSFGLGYFVDGYIDFGYIGMLFPLVLLALFVSFIYRTFYKMNRLNILIRYSLINVGLYNFLSFESDAIFLFGRILTTFLVFWVLSKTVFPRLQTWLYKS